MATGPDRQAWAARLDPATWVRTRCGLETPRHQLEWWDLMLAHPRLVIVGPRYHGKTIVGAAFTAWRLVHNRGFHALLLSATETQAARMKRLVDALVDKARSSLMPRVSSDTKSEYRNGALLEAAGVGASLRGVHPNLAWSDDVLDEQSAQSSVGRRRTEDWWRGLVLGMSPDKAILTGTSLHFADLLMKAKRDPSVAWYRYSAELDEDRLPNPEMLYVETSATPEAEPTGDPRHKERALLKAEAEPVVHFDAEGNPVRPLASVAHPWGTPPGGGAYRDPDMPRDQPPRRRPRSSLRRRL
jgi:hypothetical protein